MRLHVLVALFLLVVVLTGCQQLGPSEGQLRAMEGTSTSLCFKSPGWNGSAVEVHVASFGGKATGTAGGGGEATCGSSVVKFTNEGKVAKP